VGPFHGSHREAQHQEYMTDQDAVDASDVIAKVVHLKATLPLGLHLMWGALGRSTRPNLSRWEGD
jgi:hypothetical protein